MIKLSQRQILYIVLAILAVIVIVGLKTKWRFGRSYLEGDAEEVVEGDDDSEFDDEEMSEEELKALEDEYGLEEDMFDSDDEDDETDEETDDDE